MKSLTSSFIILVLTLLAGTKASAVTLSDADVENLVRRSYPYVAMYNVNNKFAQKQGGWNACVADTELKDHTMRDIARPNNDTLYISCLLDLRKDPVILEVPAFDSQYVSLMITGYDHYVNIPMATRVGDFRKPEKMLIYTTRSEGYEGEPVEGVDRLFEATGDFVSAVFRVMPHANDPARFERIAEQMQAVLAVSIIGPIGIPQEEAVYPQVATADGEQMNAMHDYVIRMARDELPPARAFWSVTLYDLNQGFFIPNDRKKYSVGENAGMQLNQDAGIEIYIAAEKPEGVPEENWLPIPRTDLDLSPQLRIYVPDLERLETWKAPKAERLQP